MSNVSKRFRLVVGVFSVVLFGSLSTVRAENLIRMDFNDAAGDQSLVNAGTISVTATMVTNVSYSESRPTLNRDGYSASFDNQDLAGDNHISFGDLDELDGMSNMTVCLWVRPQERVVDWGAYLLEKGTWGWGVSLDGLYRPGLYVNGWSTGVSPNGLLLGHWTFLAITYDGTSTNNNVICYTGDGVTLTPQATNTFDHGTIGSTSDEFWVGTKSGSSSNNSFYGRMDGVRVYNEILDAAALATIMKEDDASSSDAEFDDGKLVQMDFNTKLGDSTLENGGGMLLNPQFGPETSYSGLTPAVNYGGHSASFNSTNDAGTNYISLAEGTEFNELGELSKVTFCMWVRQESNDGSSPALLTYDGSIGSHGWRMYMSNITPAFYGNGYYAGKVGNALTLDQWEFVALTYDGTLTNNNLICYQGTDSTLTVTTNTFDRGMLRATKSDMILRIGDRGTGGHPFQGKLDNIRIYDRILGKSRLEEIMAYDDSPPQKGTVVFIQ